MITNEQLQNFCDAVTAKRKAYYESQGFDLAVHGFMPVDFTVGPKFAKVWTNEHGRRASIFCFVDMATGDILKAAGVNAPAKGSRGNIANGAADVGPYGAAYKR